MGAPQTGTKRQARGLSHAWHASSNERRVPKGIGAPAAFKWWDRETYTHMRKYVARGNGIVKGGECQVAVLWDCVSVGGKRTASCSAHSGVSRDPHENETQAATGPAQQFVITLASTLIFPTTHSPPPSASGSQGDFRTGTGFCTFCTESSKWTKLNYSYLFSLQTNTYTDPCGTLMAHCKTTNANN